MKKRRTAREMELEAATAPHGTRVVAPPALPGEAVAMLVRRGLRPRPAVLDLPFPPDRTGEAAERLSQLLGHYGFRLFLRGAIKKSDGFVPEETTQYLKPAQSRAFAETLVSLGLAVKRAERRYWLIRPAKSFGATLEVVRRTGAPAEVGV